MLPRLASAKGNDKFLFNELLERGWKYSLIFALLVTSAGVPLAYEFTNFFFGDLYANSVVTLQILLCGAAFAYMVNFLQTVIISIDKQKILISVAISGLIINVILNYFAIKMYGYVGAAIVTILVEAIVFVLFSYYTLKISAARGLITQLLKVTGCWLLPAIPIMLMPVDNISYVRALLWASGFIVLLRFTGVINDQEWSRLTMVFQNIK
jgi:O-antigen/teichoic acid export membrane protein